MRTLPYWIVACVMTGPWASRTAVAASLTPVTIMTRNFFVGKVKTSKSDISLRLVSRDHTIQRRRLVVTSRLQHNGVYSDLVTRFTYPEDIRGTAFLERQHPSGNDDLWIYLPALHNVRRIVANDKRNSFFGTDFSYGDILPSRVSDYRYLRQGSVVVHGHPCYAIESIPKTQEIARQTGYGHKVTWVRKDNFVTEQIIFYGRSGRKLKVLEARRVRPIGKLGHHWQAMRETMTNVRTGHVTVYTVRALHVDIRAPRRYFSARTLMRH
ncbi:MAG: outer membrane lipoprotein-sorting protein [Acidiferrobacter sp.]